MNCRAGLPCSRPTRPYLCRNDIALQKYQVRAGLCRFRLTMTGSCAAQIFGTLTVGSCHLHYRWPSHLTRQRRQLPHACQVRTIPFTSQTTGRCPASRLLIYSAHQATNSYAGPPYSSIPIPPSSVRLPYCLQDNSSQLPRSLRLYWVISKTTA